MLEFAQGRFGNVGAELVREEDARTHEVARAAQVAVLASSARVLDSGQDERVALGSLVGVVVKDGGGSRVLGHVSIMGHVGEWCQQII